MESILATMSLYDILGVDKDVDAAELKKAYRNKAKENHEDKGGDSQKMIEVNHAWMVLRDPARRDKYDRTGSDDNDGFDLRFQGYVQSIFMSIVEQNDVDYTDLIGEFRAYNRRMISDNRKKVPEARKRLRKLEKVLERLGGISGQIGVVVNRNIEQIRMEIGSIEDNIKFLQECGECLESYHYKFDEKPTEPETHIYWQVTPNI